ncbi:MAG TPA: DsbC family protein [Rhizobacter sp.]|nr:DsbC family protein [Rhizobacter sp.]
MKKLLALTVIATLASVAQAAHAETAQEAAVRKLIQPRVPAAIDSVTKTPYLGLFEVRTGTEVVYTDAGGKYIFMGSIVDSKTAHDYTRARVDDLSRIRFADLPLQLALKQVKGTGERQIAIFEDPNCGYCKRLRETLQGLDNVTLYTFMYNILSDESAAISKNIWCASDPAKAWDDWMLNAKAVPTAPLGCQSPNDKVFALGQKLKINGTPTLFFADGSRVPGAIDVLTLEAKLTTAKAVR